MRRSRFKTRTFLTVLILASSLPAKESVRGELSRLQKENGLTLAWYYVGFSTARFADRSVATERGSPAAGKYENALLSPDGTEMAFPSGAVRYTPEPKLAIVKRDGTVLREYPELGEVRAACWSRDKSQLVITRSGQLAILNLASGTTRQFGAPVSYVSSQCWSPDNHQIVYSVDKDIRIYDAINSTSHTLAHADDASWSPDGKWIALQEGDRYLAISPSGGETKVLFKAQKPRSVLWWSPDSRMVAYLGEGGTFWETLKVLDVGLLQLRVRRLADGAEDWVYQTPDVPPAWFISCEWLSANEHLASRQIATSK